MAKLKNLLIREECPMRATLKYDENALSLRDNTTIYNGVLSIFTEDIDDISELKDIDYSYLDEKFEDKLFKSKKQKKAFIDNNLDIINRFYAKLKDVFFGKKLLKGVKGTVEIGKEKIYLSTDLVLEDKNNIHIVNIKNSDSILKSNSQKEESDIYKSLELYCMYLLGESLYPGKSIQSSIVYLKDKTKGNMLNPLGSYMVTRHYKSNDCDSYFQLKVKDLLSKPSHEKSSDIDRCKRCEYFNFCNYTHSLEVFTEEEKTSPEELVEPGSLPNIKYTAEQESVISFKEGIGLVNAVAGAGKTATLVKRLSDMLEGPCVTKEDVLVVSFSEKSVEEFFEKLKKNHGITDFEHVYTFNGLGDKILKDNYGIFRFKKMPRLINVMEKYEIITRVVDESTDLKELELITNNKWDTKDCIIRKVDYSNLFMKSGKNMGLAFQLENIFNKIKSKGLNYTKLEFIIDNKQEYEIRLENESNMSLAQIDKLVRVYEAFLGKIFDMYEKYDYILKSKGLYDYADQINYLKYALVSPRLKDFFYFKHIICDEFQDSNDLAMDILKLLSTNPEFKSLLVVGDLNQAIYGFQGARPENLITFETRFKQKVHVFNLSNTFRVPPAIAEKANMLMLNSPKVKYNEMVSASSEKGKIIIENDNSKLVAFIKEALSKGETIGMIAFKNIHLEDYINLLIENDIKYIVKANLDIMKKGKVKNILHFGKVFINPYDHILEFMEYLQVADNLEFNKHYATEEFKNYFEKRFGEFLILIDFKTPIELLNIYYEKMEEIAKQDYMIETFLEHLKKQRFSSIHELEFYCSDMDLYGLSIKAEENKIDVPVVLTTGHSSKGKEFDNVIMDVSTFKTKTEDDRRLFYVAMTRAKKTLCLTSTNRRTDKKTDCSAYLKLMKIE